MYFLLFKPVGSCTATRCLSGSGLARMTCGHASSEDACTAPGALPPEELFVQAIDLLSDKSDKLLEQLGHI